MEDIELRTAEATDYGITYACSVHGKYRHYEDQLRRYCEINLDFTTIGLVTSRFAPESFRPPLRESFRPPTLSRFAHYLMSRFAHFLNLYFIQDIVIKLRFSVPSMKIVVIFL